MYTSFSLLPLLTHSLRSTPHSPYSNSTGAVQCYMTTWLGIITKQAFSPPGVVVRVLGGTVLHTNMNNEHAVLNKRINWCTLHVHVNRRRVQENQIARNMEELFQTFEKSHQPYWNKNASWRARLPPVTRIHTNILQNIGRTCANVWMTTSLHR